MAAVTPTTTNVLNNKSLVSSANYLTDLDSTYSKHVTIDKNNIHIPNGVVHSVELSVSIFNKSNLTDDVFTSTSTVNSNSSMLAYLNGIDTEVSSIIGDATITSVASVNANTIEDLSFNLECSTTETVIKNISVKVSYGNVVKYDIKSISNDYIKLFTNAGLLTKEELSRVALSIESIDSIVNVSENMDDVNTVSTNINNINTVKTNISDINTLASDIGSVNTVNDNINKVVNVSDNIEEIKTSNLHYNEIKTVSDHISNVDTNALNISDINTNADNILDIKNVSTNISDVNTVSDDLNLVDSSVKKVSSNISDVNLLSDNMTDINTVSDNISGVNTVSSNINKVSTVNEHINNLNILSSNINKLITDANNIGSISIVANDLNLSSWNNISDAGSITEAVVVEELTGSRIEIVSEHIPQIVATGNNIADVVTVASLEDTMNTIIYNMNDINTASQNALTATAKATAANNSAIDANDSETMARKWATEPENVPVTGIAGSGTEEYSAYHYAKKAESVLGGNITLDSLYDVDTTGVQNGALIMYDSNDSRWRDYDFQHNPYIGFDVNANHTVTHGQTTWNSIEGTINVGLENGNALRVGQNNIRKVTNESGSIILSGALVMHDGVSSTTGRIKVKSFTSGFNDAIKLYGLSMQSITNNGSGIIVLDGKVNGLNTSGSTVGETWNDGDTLYSKPNSNGLMTKVVPADNELKIVVARVVKSDSINGILEIGFNAINENSYYTKVQNDILLDSKVPLSGDFTLDLGGL